MECRTSVFVHADDAVILAGLEYLLRQCSEVYVVPTRDIDTAHVAILGVDRIDDAAVRTVAGIQRDGCPRVLIVAAVLDECAMVAAAEAGVLGLLRRQDATSASLVSTVRRVAAGRASVPDDLIAGLLQLAGRTRRDIDAIGGPATTTLSEREQEILRLLADGCSTSEIASDLCYSERTVKGVIHDFTSRLQLRNRSHAVAFALRNGII